ncbi:MAG: hypothetical protein EOP09_01255 [Proteobacteria bacterium]|nr:MAG: hypothetical protein EOP09_01255 [Pseudomonadota bacterium]
MALVLGSSAYADDSLDTPNQAALDKTMQMLRDVSQREKAAQENTAAASAHADVQKLGGLETQNQVYDMSADVLQIAIKETGGDPVKLQAWIANAQKDPSGFLGSRLPASTRQKIESLAKQLDKK